MFQWRRFRFFDQSPIKETGPSGGPLLSKLEIVCSASGHGTLMCGDAEGYINVVDREFKVTSFRAFTRTVTAMCQLRQRNLLVSVGEEDDSTITPTLKIWNFDRVDENGEPQLLKTFRMSKAAHGVPATYLEVLDDMTHIAVGLANGDVVLISSADLSRDRNPQQIIVRNPKTKSAAPVTCLGFHLHPKHGLVLFVVLSNQIFSFFVQSRELEVLDEQGCELYCGVMSNRGEMVLGRPEAVYFYECDGRGPCFAFEGNKRRLFWFRSYLIIVGQDTAATQKAFNTLTIYDLSNKFIAYSATFNNVVQVVSEWGSVYIITKDGQMYQLQEKDTQTKLETLFKKNLYSVAINLAKSQSFDQTLIVDIFRRYGDHLYSKGDYDGAINQYLKTIGQLEPSYVIRKFLDAQRIYNLTSYLQTLHEKSMANSDHTTLLLNCYTKLKDVEKLDKFIKTDADLNFEVETAIKCLRQADYYEHALYLAKKHMEHDWYLKILLEDVKNYEKALAYIETLDFFEAEKNLKKYGKALVSELPEQTTKLLMRLCTDYHPTILAENDGKAQKANFVPPSAEMSTAAASSTGTKGKNAVRAVPDEFIHIFVNQTYWLTTFLEYMLAENPDCATAALNNTLLELYLQNDISSEELSDKERSEQSKERKRKAIQLLTNPNANIDENHALVLCQMHSFDEGILYLYEKMHLFNEIVQYYMEQNNHSGILTACKKYGDKDPNMWVQALSYFAGKEEDCNNEITEVLRNIDRDNLLPPLLVVQILAQKKAATLAVIKDYITQRLQHENQLILQDQRQIRDYMQQTEKMKAEIEELRTSAKIFQLSKCSACTSPLDLPAVHFLCMHSFHQRCLGENERECPLCAPNNRKILEIKRTLEENASQHDQFFKQLEGSADGFSVVSEYFGRGIFNKVILVGGENADNLPPTIDLDSKGLLFDR